MTPHCCLLWISVDYADPAWMSAHVGRVAWLFHAGNGSSYQLLHTWAADSTRCAGAVALPFHVEQQSRTVPLTIAVVDVASIRAAAMRAVQAPAASAAVHLRLVFDLNEPKVFGDTVAIRRMLDSLLVNAIAATPTDAEVVLRVHAEDHTSILLTVNDDGAGIPLPQQERIFEPLVRLRSGPGFGLGLAIVRELTRALEGQCGVGSDGNSGSAFWVRLRRAVDE